MTRDTENICGLFIIKKCGGINLVVNFSAQHLMFKTRKKKVEKKKRIDSR